MLRPDLILAALFIAIVCYNMTRPQFHPTFQDCPLSSRLICIIWAIRSINKAGLGNLHGMRYHFSTSYFWWHSRNTSHLDLQFEFLKKNRTRVLFFKLFSSWAPWAKTRKKVRFGRTMHCLPQRLKSMFFEKHSSRGSFRIRDPPLENISKNVDFSLWSKQCIGLPKWTFSRVLADCGVINDFLKG